MPAAMLNRVVVMCVPLPAPVVPKKNLPGRACAISISSLIDLLPSEGDVASTLVGYPTCVTATNSLIGAYGAGADSIAFTANDEEIMLSVYPSGFALATIALASDPPAPDRFSYTTGCFHSSESFGPMTRAVKSVELPAEKPITMRTGRSGHFCALPCACAHEETPISHAEHRQTIALMEHLRWVSGHCERED